MAVNAPLDWSDIKKNAAKFVLRFQDVRKEASYKQIFWSEFLQMFGVDIIQVGAFEYYVKKLGVKHGEIDYFWPGKVIIEHKSSGKDLDAAMDQAMDYLLGIEKKEELPRYIIVSDFKRIRLMDLVEHRDDTIRLQDLPDNIEMFGFLAGYSDKRIEGQHPVNVKAAEVMGELYDHLRRSNYPEEDVNLLLSRLVFCLFAEDADIFEKHLFSSYVSFYSSEDGTGVGSTLNEVFEVLNTRYEDRQTMMSSELQKFPYVNGGLFAKRLATPMFDREMRDCLLGASKLDWKYISPAIFGSLFQSIMDPKKRRELGAHYTSEENILKVINPLFMENLRAGYERIKGNPRELRKLWDRIADIRILDPACGCGNFLIISYRELRRLEMDVLDSLYKNQMILDESHLHIDHFYGIEINEFASMVANLSMILMDHLMNLEMRNRFGRCRDVIPLKEKANIVCENSLRIDWNDIVNRNQLSYIVGNPPFIGHQNRDQEQCDDMNLIFINESKSGKLDYVTAWFKKSAEFMKNTHIHAALVSTNSIVQGESVGILWKELNEMGIKISFAYRTFVWKNEAKFNAAVHCVIIGFSYDDMKDKWIITNENKTKATNINGYLIDGPNIYVQSRSKPINDLPRIIKGSQPTDGGNLFLSSSEREEMISRYPQSEKFIKRFIGAEEFINGEMRYCLWLKDVDPEEYRNIPEIRERLNRITEIRKKSPTRSVQKDAETPYLFTQIRQPNVDYLVIPRHSSGARHYIPFGFMDKDVIAGDATSIIPTDDLVVFGIISSHLHQVWLDTVGGKLKSDYRYQPFVYNSFYLPEMSESSKTSIRNASAKIIELRKELNKPLVTLYDPITMPDSLLKAHRELDHVVEKAYSPEGFKDDDARISFLFKKYEEKTA